MGVLWLREIDVVMSLHVELQVYAVDDASATSVAVLAALLHST